MGRAGGRPGKEVILAPTSQPLPESVTGLLEDLVGNVRRQMGASHTPEHSDLIGHLLQMLGTDGGVGGLAGLTQVNSAMDLLKTMM